MYRFFLLVSFLVCSIVPSHAQTIQDIGKIVLGVKILPSASTETQVLKDYLTNKIRLIATQAGYSSYGDSSFIISPNVIVNHIEMAESGMKNIYIISGDLSLSIQEQHNGTVFASILLPFKGFASKKDTAIKNAVSNIDFRITSDLFDAAKMKILAYYEAQEDAIFTRADTYVSNKEYDKAIACLMTIPEELFELYKKALVKANEIYEIRDEEIRREEAENLRHQNDEVLATARSLLAMHDPIEALKELWSFQTGEDDQNQVYHSMISQAETMISEKEKKAIEKERQAYEDQKRREDREWIIREKESAHRQAIELQQMENQHAESMQELQLEQQRINAIKNIACEYIKSQYNSNDISNNY